MVSVVRYLILVSSIQHSLSFLKTIHRNPAIWGIIPSNAIQVASETLTAKPGLVKVEYDESNNYSALLTKDIEMLSEILGEVVRKESPAVHKVFDNRFLNRLLEHRH